MRCGDSIGNRPRLTLTLPTVHLSDSTARTSQVIAGGPRASLAQEAAGEPARAERPTRAYNGATELAGGARRVAASVGGRWAGPGWGVGDSRRPGGEQETRGRRTDTSSDAVTEGGGW